MENRLKETCKDLQIIHMWNLRRKDALKINE